MQDETVAKVSGKRKLSKEIATRTTDPNFYGALNYLPNPDPILRKLGRGQEVFDAIMMDAHVIGELRSVRSGLLGFESRIRPGGDSPQDIAAMELCQNVFKHLPSPSMRWPDVTWNMAHAVFRGYAVHEVVWSRQGQYLVPVKLIDRPQRRFTFSPDNELRLLTRNNMIEGDELGPYKWLLSRHMPSHDNPYGVALFSSCFWPYTFKHNGFRFFVKFAEKYGLPWAVGKYPPGTPQSEQNDLADALAQMVEDAVAAIPADDSVELIESSHSGQLVHERLIDICNREMSKALTSQTLATEIQGEGSRAASETHRDREQSVNESDREVISDTYTELCRWITEINFSNAAPPVWEFYEEAEARQEWVTVLSEARDFVDIPVNFAHERLQIPQPEPGEDILPRTVQPAPIPPAEFSGGQCPHCNGVHEFKQHTPDATTQAAAQAADQADKLIASMVDEVRELLDRVDTLTEVRDGLTEIYPDIDETRLGEMTSLALMTGLLQGMDEAETQ